jgi:thiol:disulfide interchange protein DsbD
MDSRADKTSGLLSIFFMAFTLALVSFSCTGPIIGTLLVEAAVSGARLGPFMGMLGFSVALAVPFSIFAIFPSWLNSMPKSGGWLNSVKVVLGFLELALAFKFLSVADLSYHWGLLDRDVFLAIWIVIFTLLGFYLLGKLRFPHDSDMKRIPVFSLFLAIISFSFAVYMVPGMWGAPVKAVAAFAPPPITQDFSLYDSEVHAKFTDYEAGMEYAKRKDKPVIVDFTGWGCVNCRKMENSVWTDQRIHDMLINDYVLISLFVDDKTKLPEHEVMTVTENGKTRELNTVGRKWSYLQRMKFGNNSQPFYVILDHQGNVINKPRAYNKDVTAYRNWLRDGLKKFEEINN